MVYIFENGKGVRVSLGVYEAKTKRKKITGAYSSASPLAGAVYEAGKPTKLFIRSDTGKGMPSSMHKDIFKPGYSTKQRGWGLGLSLAKRIINEYHKGKIFVKYSVPDQGTVFRIVLKRKRS